MDLTNTALLTHRSCLDGSTCSIVFCAAGGNKNNIRFSSPSHDKSDEAFLDLYENWDGPIIVADLSVSYNVALTVSLSAEVYLLDHHKSAIPLDEFSWCEIEVDNHRAGGKMLFDFLYDNVRYNSDPCFRDLKDLVEAADDHDRWIKEIPESDTLATLHNVLGQKRFINRFLKTPELSLTENERYVLNLEDEKREEYIKNAKKNLSIVNKSIDGKQIKVAYLLANKHQSRLGHAIYEDVELDIDVVIMISNRSISMRSRPNCPLDLSMVAKKFNGGGHLHAGGMSLGQVIGKDLIELVVEKLQVSF